ncbi:universal stress protein [Actinomadura barringtoniae]|uniref:Universal stress protein n=1 Tax=Actinomadura barringtoniae TaxID=1427535 RepID=A0A939PEX4_9ACTN|nr:universal stress protein [Actinomadura barringtoniae]MBO2447949.1 universal stress protein [Actinomadura barringtoniae]
MPRRGAGSPSDAFDLHHEVARLCAEYPTVEPRGLLVAEDPAKALIQAAGHARMLVVGSRGAGGVRGLALGSVSQRLVRHSPCTLIVAHANQ